MKITSALIMLLVISGPALACKDLTEFYYDECLENAAVIDTSPNFDGSPHVPGGIFDASNPQLYSFCRHRAIEKMEGR